MWHFKNLKFKLGAWIELDSYTTCVIFFSESPKSHRSNHSVILVCVWPCNITSGCSNNSFDSYTICRRLLVNRTVETRKMIIETFLRNVLRILDRSTNTQRTVWIRRKTCEWSSRVERTSNDRVFMGFKETRYWRRKTESYQDTFTGPISTTPKNFIISR